MSKNETELGFIITFYSYKGGVGRSMALANTACLIAEQEISKSKRVLIIDWDLEAPGLHRFFPAKCDLPENVGTPGLIEYFSNLKKKLEKAPALYKKISEEDQGWKVLNKSLPLDPYVIRDVQPGIDLIKAGNIDSTYAERVSTFDWIAFYNLFDGFFEPFSELLSHTYSYCMIDSRTGFTDTSGVCTTLLPEKLVLVFTPNEQSTNGVIDIAKFAVNHRRSSGDMRPLMVYPLPSRIDDSEDDLRKEWREKYQKFFEETFRESYDLDFKQSDMTAYFDEVKLPHKSYYAYGEKLAVLNERDESFSLHRAYKTFCDILVGNETPWEFGLVGGIPSPPEKYVVHPYTLLQTPELIGRRNELNLLTDWVAAPKSDVFNAHLMCIVAIGGAGKSALAWNWFNDIAPEKIKPLAGRMWWSFYESDASFENFVIRALAYTSGSSTNEIKKISVSERESGLLSILDREPFLIVLDGLERILLAYSRIDAASISEDEVESHENIRKTADPRAGQFLKKLARIKAARILISTRLQPAELENEVGVALPGTFRLDLEGLTDEDAVALWRSFEVSGSPAVLLPTFDTFDKHPVLIQALASEVKRYRKAPGDFKKWREANPSFDPASMSNLQEIMAHVLGYALRGLNDREQRVLQTIAAFRRPANYETLVAILVGEGKSCTNESELDDTLTNLENRGLVGWDKRANRYDMHPIVRGVVWNGLNENKREVVYEDLKKHFESIPAIDDWHKVNSFEDLIPTVELYGALVGLGRYDDALELFYRRLGDVIIYRLNASRQLIELMEMLLPDGLNHKPRLRKIDDQSYALNNLAVGYKFIGQPGRSISFSRRVNAIYSETKVENFLGISLTNTSDSLRLIGELFESEADGARALIISREQGDKFLEMISLLRIGLTMAVRGDMNRRALDRSLHLTKALATPDRESELSFAMSVQFLWRGEFSSALTFADRGWELARIGRNERDFVRAARVQGEAALGLDNMGTADERLHHALTRARTVNYVEEEVLSLNALAELRRREGDEKAAREFLDDVWEYAERGPYPLYHADALNVLAQIERDAGNTDKAIEAATKAYKLAWCDGPPYAYHWGLIKARKHLEELGASLPDMPPFDESKYEPMPEVEIDPDDEFHVGEESS